MKNRLFPSLLLASACVASPASVAQGVVQPLPGTTDADALADQMRRVTANPQDVGALVTAGELSLKLDDLSGAASLFARAEKIDPRNGRVKAGEASLLLRSERPGEALRYFGQAESYGLIPERFAADRGLAYDLIGQQERAQRDYRLALQTRNDDETVRRYALSLGISGRKDEALEQLAPLLRRQDRGAWRARAFVLAMDGDVASASRIATTMMPPGMAQGLQPFFERLPSLPAADRAFAVHFGEVRPTPERLADARLAPALTPLAPERGAPVRVASVRPIAPVEAARSDKRRDRRTRREATQLVAVQPVAAPAPVRLAAVAPRPIAPAPTSASVAAAVRPRYVRQEVPNSLIPRLIRIDPPRSSAVAVTTSVAAASVAPASPAIPATPRSTYPPSVVASARRVAAVAPQAVPVQSRPVAISAPVAASSAPLATPSSATLAAAPPAVSTPVTSVAASPVARPVAPIPTAQVAAVSPPAVPASVAAAPARTPAVRPATPRPGFSSLPDAEVAAAAPSPVRRDGDAVLAKIVAGLTVPASELDVTEPARPAAVRRSMLVTHVTEPTPAVARSHRRETLKPADEVEFAALDGKPTGRRSGAKGKSADAGDEADAPPLTRAEKRAAARKATSRKTADDEVAEADTPQTPAEKRVAARKATADKKALADKKAAADKKALADKDAAEERKAAKTNPERIWVQVSGGANEDDLPKAYATVKARAPDAFAGRAAYATPLRATNRVLTGPFKTDAEARAFVNQLAKKGVSAFTFTSDKGQKVERLGSKSAK